MRWRISRRMSQLERLIHPGEDNPTRRSSRFAGRQQPEKTGEPLTIAPPFHRLADGTEFCVAHDALERKICTEIRLAVFVEEQQIALEEELDGLDQLTSTFHVLARSAQGEPLGTARLLVNPEYLAPGPAPGEAAGQHAQIGRVAVMPQVRGSGVGAGLMRATLALAQQVIVTSPADTVRVIGLSAQESVIGFYERLGYRLTGRAPYLDAALMHRDMQIVLPTLH